MNEIIVSNADKINSQTLLQMVNEARKLCGEKPVRNNDFIAKVKDELEGEGYEIFVTPMDKEKGGADQVVINMTYKQAMRVAARESKAVRRSLVDQLEELQQKALAAPQQQTQLIPGTPEHFLDFITQGVTQALTQAYREYFGEPVLQNALVDQQQHTEPVQTGVEYRKPPQDKRSWAKLSKYIARKDIVMKCFEICDVHSEQFDPGYILDEDGRLIHCDEHTVYDRKQALAVILAIYELSVPVKNSKTRREIAGKKFKDKLGNRCFTDIPQDAVDSAKRMIQAYIMKHGKLI